MRPTGTIVDPLPRYRLVEDSVSGNVRELFLPRMTFQGKPGDFQTVLKTVVYKQGFLGVILFTIKCESTVCLQK